MSNQIHLYLLQMAYTDLSGVSHPNSVWFPSLVTIDNTEMKGSIEWYGYHDAITFGARKELIDQHHTIIDPATFFAASSNIVPSNLTVAQVIANVICISFGLSIPDTLVFDSNGVSTGARRPFFQGAQQIVVLVDIP